MLTRSFVLFSMVCAFPMLLGAGGGGCDRTEIGSNDPVCGDGVLDDGEACDSEVPAGTSCADQGFAGGALACADDCTLDTSGCVAAACDDDETADCACADGTAGVMTCAGGEWGDCECEPATCDEGDTATCACEGGETGTMTCAGGEWGDCECGGAVCGDEAIEGGEACDGPDLGGHTCASLGFAGGELACDDACVFDTTACTTGECLTGETESCACPAGMAGERTCVDGHWADCVCTAIECTPGDTMSCACPGGDTGTMTCEGGLWADCAGCAAEWCGDGTCNGAESEATCPVDCMADLPVEGEHCVEVGVDWLCAPGFACQAVTDLAGETSRFCYLEGCTTAADCAASIIEDSPVAMPDYTTGYRTQCMTVTNPEGLCVGYTMPFFIDEGTPATAAPIPGPVDDFMCRPCDPLSMVLPDQYFDDNPWDVRPFAAAELRCRRHCVDDTDCGEGRCLARLDLSTEFYSCIVLADGFCCLPGDTAPECL